MYKVYLVSLLFIGFIQGIKPDEEVGNHGQTKNSSPISSRIIGGSYAKMGQFPYQVSLRRPDLSHACGGTIIDKKWIVTAAHCIHEVVPWCILMSFTELHPMLLILLEQHNAPQDIPMVQPKYINSTNGLFLQFLTRIKSQDANSKQMDTRIVGGTSAALGLIPYQVSLRYSSMAHGCGGTIIDRNWIITAAHCIDGMDIEYVFAGSIYLNSGGVRLNVAKTIKHPEYNPNTISNDIGLVKTVQSFTYGKYIKPLSLPTFNIGGGYSVRVSGWGLTSYPGSIPNTLQYLQVLTLTNSECSRSLKPFVIDRSHLCTLRNVGQGTCSGDSGGPMMYANQLHGVVSFSKLCAKGVPDGFARVYEFNSWISSTMSSN
ncbi:chymotrypsin-2-like [Arctopsyche grandis]|uniref:chymotrypsin-2-like n=1 Tax=Arctopsyche grandis TaxID=121162 RepID=UPI00406D783F